MSFNARNKKKYPEYSILLHCYEKGNRKSFVTGLTTTDKLQDDCSFADKYESAEMNVAKGKRLQSLYDACCLFVEENYFLSWDEKMDALQNIINGENAKVDKDICYYINAHMQTYDKKGTQKIWKRTYDLVKEFGERADMDSVSVDWLQRFEDFLLNKVGLAIPTAGIHMRNIKTTIKEQDEIKSMQLFKKYKIKEEISYNKQSLRKQQLADIRDIELDECQSRYRDVFMLSIYLGGINIGDMCKLTRANVKNGWLMFVRTKTDKKNKKLHIPVRVPLMPEAMRLINRYKGEKHLLYFLDDRKEYASFERRCNENLKRIGYTRIVKDKVGKMRKHEHHAIEPTLCLQIGRKTFATMCNKCGVPERVAGLLMGHSWAAQNTTQIYQTIDDDDLWDGMRKAIDYMNGLQSRPKEVIYEEIKMRDGID